MTKKKKSSGISGKKLFPAGKMIPEKREKAGKTVKNVKKEKKHLPAKGDVLEKVLMVSQSHPLSVASPFNIVWDYHKEPVKELNGDVHYALQISIVLRGRAEAVVGSHSRIYQAGEGWFVMCWEPHAYRPVSRRTLILSVNISADSIGNCGPYADADWLTPFTVEPARRYCPATAEEREGLLRTARNLLHLSRKQPSYWHTRCWLSIHELILTAGEHISHPAEGEIVLNGNISRIMKAVSRIRLLPVPLSLEEAASASSLSVSRFSSLFHSVMGVSYGQFALRVRLGNAANDIKGGLFTLNEIAFRHGFCDASSLCNAFKKVYHCTPAQFKLRK